MKSTLSAAAHSSAVRASPSHFAPLAGSQQRPSPRSAPAAIAASPTTLRCAHELQCAVLAAGPPSSDGFSSAQLWTLLCGARSVPIRCIGVSDAKSSRATPERVRAIAGSMSDGWANILNRQSDPLPTMTTHSTRSTHSTQVLPRCPRCSGRQCEPCLPTPTADCLWSRARARCGQRPARRLDSAETTFGRPGTGLALGEGWAGWRVGTHCSSTLRGVKLLNLHRAAHASPRAHALTASLLRGRARGGGRTCRRSEGSPCTRATSILDPAESE